MGAPDALFLAGDSTTVCDAPRPPPPPPARAGRQALPRAAGAARVDACAAPRQRSARGRGLPAARHCATRCPASAKNSRASRACVPPHPGGDGSSRLLLDLADGQSVEAVLLPKGGLCVSTQVGCAVGCVFCMTGREGLKRHLGSAEIVAQVALARAHAPGEEGRLHGHGRARAQPRGGDGRDRAAGHRGRHRPQEPRLLDGGRSALRSSGCPGGG